MIVTRISRSLVVAVAGVVILGLGGTASAVTVNKCAAGKNRCAVTMLKALIACHVKTDHMGILVDAACLDKAKTKFDPATDPAKGCFEKVEAKEKPGKPKTTCLTHDDTKAIKDKIEAFRLDLVTDLDPAFPAAVKNKCSARKKKCAVTKLKALIACYVKAENKGIAVDPACLNKAKTKFDGGTDTSKGCFEKLEGQEKPNKPETLCLTHDDTKAIETKIDAFVDDLVCEIDPPSGTCLVTSEIGPWGWSLPNYDERNSRFYPHATRTNVSGTALAVKWQATGTSRALTGDVNGDGAQEVVAVAGDLVQVYSATGVLLNTLTNIGNLALLADLNKDGRLDVIAYKISGSTINVRGYDAITSILLRTFSKTSLGSYPPQLDVLNAADLDGDGIVEIIVPWLTPWKSPRGVIVFNGSTGAETGYYGIGPFPRSVSIANVTGDAKLEMLFGGGGPHNNVTGGDGSYDGNSYVWLIGANAGGIWRRPFNSGGFYDSSGMLADLDHDGATDVIACPTSHGWGAWDGGVGGVRLLNPVDGSVRAGYSRDFGRPVQVVAVGDLEKGGSDEILLLLKNGGVKHWYLRVLSAAPGFPDVASLDLGVEAPSPTLNDVDGDGQVELLIAFQNKLHCLGANLAEEWTWVCPGDPPRRVGTPIVSDLDGDGINEIVVGCGDSAANYGVYVIAPSL